MIERDRLPDPVSNRRVSAGSLIRLLYGLLILGLGIVLGWLMIKPLIFLQASGEVTSTKVIMSVPFGGRVTEINVTPGQYVGGGQPVASIDSPEFQSRLLELSMALTEQLNQEIDQNSRLEVARLSLPSAKERLASATDALNRLRGGECFATSTFCAQVYREHAEATNALLELQASVSAAERQIQRTMALQLQIQGLQKQVSDAFNNGRVRSAVSGVISSRIADEGQTVLPGEPIVTILSVRDLHIEWFLEPGYLRRPNVGDVVYVMAGPRVLRGTITELLSIADRPDTASSIFRAPSSGQLVRVELDEGLQYPPLLSPVEVRFNYWPLFDDAVDFYLQVMRSAGVWQ